MSFSLRPIGPEDMPFLLRLYRSTREEELAMVVDWTDEQKDWFILMQFNAQHAWYQEHYVGASFDVILVDDAPAGRLYVHRREKEIRLVDISFLPEFRNRGLGTSLLQDLFTEAEAASLPLTIHVEKYNPAMRLYQRLGFTRIDETGPYDLMEWRPGKADQLNTASYPIP